MDSENEYRIFKLQIQRGVGGRVFWTEIVAKSKTEAQSKYWANNPGDFIVRTIDTNDQ